MDKRFEELLLAYGEANDPLRRGEIEARLWQEFGVTRAVLVMDLSRFSNMTERYGIVYNLSVVQRMRLIARPLIEGAGGTLVKSEADNCFAMFEEVPSAVRAAAAIHRAFEELNSASQEQFDLRVGIGIDYGEVLLTGSPDYFGMTVNRACKLGEDLAGPGEILISEAAYLHLPPGTDLQAEPLELTIAGISLPARRIVH
jgi:class 3 adenylate cyclase